MIPPITLVSETLSALVVGRVLTRASTNLLGLLLARFLTLNLLSDLYLSVDSQVLSCIGSQ